MPTGEEHAYLLARSSLDDYLGFLADYATDGAGSDRRRLVTEWKAAADRMEELRADNPDRADGASIEPLPPALRPLAAKVEADPIFRRAFSDAEYELAVIELDRVVVSQKLVSLEHVRRLQAQLGPKPTAEALFKFCLPFDRQPPLHRASRIGEDEFAFVSESSDLRFLEAVMLRPDQIADYQSVGPVAGVIALVVGFGSNYLNVLSVNDRLILNNGNHRACALWSAGVRRVPCVVQTITHPDEIDVHAPRAVKRSPELYLTGPRPPLLGDYFDPVLSRRVNLALTRKQVRVGYTVEEKDMP
jgi:hypothetical protein